MSASRKSTDQNAASPVGLPQKPAPVNIRFVYETYKTMGIVKISEHMHENLRLSSAAFSRSINAQAEHWLRVGRLAELNPALCYSEICQLLIQAEQSLQDREDASKREAA